MQAISIAQARETSLRGRRAAPRPQPPAFRAPGISKGVPHGLSPCVLISSPHWQHRPRRSTWWRRSGRRLGIQEILHQAGKDHSAAPVEVHAIHVELPAVGGTDLVPGLPEDEVAERVAIDRKETKRSQRLAG